MIVCKHCNDTHEMNAWNGSGAQWMCTRCPTPCQKCRAGCTGAFCDKTPCSCNCHVKTAKIFNGNTDRFNYLKLEFESNDSNRIEAAIKLAWNWIKQGTFDSVSDFKKILDLYAKKL